MSRDVTSIIELQMEKGMRTWRTKSNLGTLSGHVGSGDVRGRLKIFFFLILNPYRAITKGSCHRPLKLKPTLDEGSPEQI